MPPPLPVLQPAHHRRPWPGVLRRAAFRTSGDHRAVAGQVAGGPPGGGRAATGAGAFSLTENSLYTVEGWKVFLDRLKSDGILTVTRWYNPNIKAETGRLLSLAVATLLESGAKDPSKHIAVIATKHIAVLLLNKSPFSDYDIAKLAVNADGKDCEIKIHSSFTEEALKAASLFMASVEAAKEQGIELETEYDNHGIKLKKQSDTLMS